ncbi:MAG TPA: tripartite tricarboxylate transporter permease [Pseudonocardia sp.]|uniref:tripartite tricarboxylate transporter permease n=1 Tax=Pseudonocardia sp. TaxID=60912 RepID=UPI002B4B1528|nr:tripartite tricarboxylate transporter permease [Pseudonocardia sp.]HLU56944.1 tripartite tricarboxylate transporter permease [Pseudonocardia sp.]
MGDLATAFAMLADPTLVVVVLASAVYGLFIGAIPGLSATLATALLVPFVFFLDPLPAIAAVITMSAMAIFAGDLPSALVRMPGTPASAAYTEDAYLQTRAGHGARALGVALLGSVIGGVVGAVVLMVAAPLLAEFALQFTSYEYFWVAVLGLTASVIISAGSQVKGAISLLIGLLLATVGIDIALGYARFTFGSTDLLQGISFIPAMIGLFGLSEVLRNVMRPGGPVRVARLRTQGMFGETLRTLRRYWRRLVSGNVIGSTVGALPGAGGDIAAWVSYAATKNTSRERHLFGKGEGHVEPIVSAGSANNAALASAYVPTLVFGIPGDTITAILLGVLLVQGVQPGPELFANDAPLLYGVYLIFIIANLLLVPLGYLAIKGSSWLLRVPGSVLMPVIVAFCVVGSFSINNGYLEIVIMLALGVLGYLLERGGFPLAPVVLGLVLGPIVEKNFMQSVIKTNWDLTQFLTRPVSAALVLLTALVLAYPLLRGLVRRRRTVDASG